MIHQQESKTHNEDLDVEKTEKSIVHKYMSLRGCSKNMIKKVINPSKRGYSFTNSEICDAILLRSISTKAYEM